RSNIRNDQTAHIEHNGEYLKSNVASKLLIEGNCDEQGTNEYNLALGERRAMNAKKYLIKLGVDHSRIRTVSYGEERPLFTGSEESDYAYNRRDDFILE
ncbi:MAG: peptidoglycan-associated lipoprotein, partial [Candidatus Electrothrix sp. ATG1]|nr:peptidoglycan-associated lipoprotein [Candidatus Electrothrix sp. ATG1]